MQDHLYDVWFLESPWVSVGRAAELFGVATLLLGVAFVVLPLLVSLGRTPRVAWFSGCVLGFSFGVQGVHMLRSGLAGQAVDTPLLMPIFFLQLVLLPLVAVTMIVRRSDTGAWPKQDAIACTVLLAALATTHPFVRAMIDIGPYDSLPRNEAIYGMALIVASLALWPATRPRLVTDSAAGCPEPESVSIGRV